MNIAALFIHRPVGTTLLTVGIALAGMLAYARLPVAPLPDVDLPTIAVSASLSGASPATMASSIAAPLEKRFGSLAGVSEMTSVSGTGTTRVILQFDLARDIDGAARDVEGAINAARADLPSTLRANPQYRKINPADAPILILALRSSSRRPDQIFDAVSNLVEQRLLQIDGVGDVELGGAALPGVRVDVNPEALAHAGITLEDVRAALSSASAHRPRGTVESARRSWIIDSDPPGRHAADFRDLPIAGRNGALVRLGDIADISDGPEDVHTLGLVGRERAVPVIISRQPGANIVATVDALKAELPRLQAALPADIRLDVVSDRTTTIRASLREVQITLVIAVLLVVAVVSLFLGSLRATLVPAIAVIVSLLGTCAIIWLLGFSLNNLTLMALTGASGFVVDDAIVVLENISRWRERVGDRIAAAVAGAREVAATVLSISLSLTAVFIPLLFMGGIVGRLFNEFAVTMGTAVLVSLILSLTATPMLAALVVERQGREGRFFRRFAIGLDRLRSAYARSLDWALAHPKSIMVLLLALVCANASLIGAAPKGFFPQQDTGALAGGIRADQSLSFPALADKLRSVARIIEADPAVASVVAFTGGTRAGSAFLYAQLKPERERAGAEEVVNRLRPRLHEVAGLQTFLTPVQDIRAGGRSANAAYQYTLSADDPVELARSADRLRDLLRQSPGFSDVDLDQQDSGVEARVTVDHDVAARIGVTSAAVDNALYDSFGQRQVATIYAGLNQYHVVLGVPRSRASSPSVLPNVQVPTAGPAAALLPGSAPVSVTGSGRDTPAGAAISTTPTPVVPLSALASFDERATPAQVNHQDGRPAATIAFNLTGNLSLGEAAARIEQARAAVAGSPSVTGGFAGTAKEFQSTFSSVPLLVLAALVAIYVVLGILYESTIHPLTVLSTIPSATVGAMLALRLAGGQFDVIALIGLILLIGIVKKNAILIIDFAIAAERERGLSARQAVREAALLRFRPILMTSVAAILAAIPLAIGFGEGAELRRPLGIVIIGGLAASQLLTLLTTPVVYVVLDRFTRRPGRRFTKEART